MPVPGCDFSHASRHTLPDKMLTMNLTKEERKELKRRIRGKYLKVREVAEMVGYHVNTVSLLLNTGSGSDDLVKAVNEALDNYTPEFVE